MKDSSDKSFSQNQILGILALEYKTMLEVDVDHVDRNEGKYNGKIELGVFDNCDEKVCAFFHELGHHLSDKPHLPTTLKINSEIEAWAIGFEKMLEHGFSIKREHILYAMTRLDSYSSYEYREFTISAFLGIREMFRGKIREKC